jgi:hypothetical protein
MGHVKNLGKLKLLLIGLVVLATQNYENTDFGLVSIEGTATYSEKCNNL